MTRIAKTDVYKALNQAGQNIIAAGGNDGVTSRKELQAHVKTLDNKTEAALTRQLFAFIDHRDHTAGARITEKDVKKAIGYAKEHLIANRDLNNNGLSASEVKNLSNLGKLAVALAEQVKNGASATLSTAELGKAVNVSMKDVNWMSEGDSTPEFVAVPFAAGKALTDKNIMTALKSLITEQFGDQDTRFSDLAAEVESMTAADWKDLTSVEAGAEDYEKAFADGFKGFKKLADANIKEMVSVKIGPKDDDGGLGSDQGFYVRLMVGRTADDKLAGIHFSVVET